MTTGTRRQVTLPWVHRQRAVPPPPPGSVMVPISIRPMRAYTQLTRDDLLLPGTGRMQTFPESPAAMASADPPLEHGGQIMNRVLRHDKAAGYVLHESDFFPPGTTPGEAAGVPPGKRAITFEAAELSGVRNLRTGDHVHLVATESIDLTKARQGSAGPVPPGMTKSAGFQQVATDGVVVSPLTVHQVPYMTAGGLTSGAQVRTRPVEEVTIAVDADQVPAVEQAVGMAVPIACLLRSGQPAANPSAAGDGTAGSGSLSNQYTAVEQIVGDKHDYKYLPTPPVAAGGRR